MVHHKGLIVYRFELNALEHTFFGAIRSGSGTFRNRGIDIEPVEPNYRERFGQCDVFPWISMIQSLTTIARDVIVQFCSIPFPFLCFRYTLIFMDNDRDKEAFAVFELNRFGISSFDRSILDHGFRINRKIFFFFPYAN